MGRNNSGLGEHGSREKEENNVLSKLSFTYVGKFLSDSIQRD
jgi:hypothetical protein